MPPAGSGSVEITFQRTETWKESNDPDRDAKPARIEYVSCRIPS